jgi:hypothetical protein
VDRSPEQMPGKECEFVRYDCLMWRPVVDIEMVDVGIYAELAFRGSPRCVDRETRRGDLVIPRDAHQPWAVKIVCMMGHVIRRF